MSQTYRIGSLNFTGSQAVLSASLNVSGSSKFQSITQGNASAVGQLSIARNDAYAGGYGSYALGDNTTQTGQLFVLATSISSGNITLDSAYDGQDLTSAFPQDALLYIYNDSGTYPISRSYYNVPQNRTLVELYNRSVSIIGSRNIIVDDANFYNTFILTETFEGGDLSHAIGIGTETGGEYSFAHGRKLIALGNHQHVVGIANKMRPESHAFIIGNGTVDNFGDATSRGNLLFASGSQVQISGSLNLSGSATVSSVLTLPYQHPLPSSPSTGSIALSGSGATFVGMFVFTGAWTQI